MASKPENVVLGAVLKKRRPKKGLGLLHLWQTRYCVILKEEAQFRYYKSKAKFMLGEDPSGVVPLNRICAVTYVPGSKAFDLELEGGRIFSFQECSDTSQVSATDWVNVLRKNTNIYNATTGINTDHKLLSETEFDPKKWKEEQDRKGNVTDNVAQLLHATPLAQFMNAVELEAISNIFTLKKYNFQQRIFHYHPMNTVPEQNMSVAKRAAKAARIRSASEKDIGQKHALTIRKFVIVVKGEVIVVANKRALCVKKANDIIPVVPSEVMHEFQARCSVASTVLSATLRDITSFFIEHPKHKSLVMCMMGCTPSKFLHNLSIFSGVEPSLLYLLQTLFSWVALPANTLLFKEGSFGDSLYVVMHGQVGARTKEHDKGNVKRKKLGEAKDHVKPEEEGAVVKISRRLRTFSLSRDRSKSRARSKSRGRSRSPLPSASRERSPAPAAEVVAPAAEEEAEKLQKLFAMGEYFGEIALTMSVPRTATIKSEKPTVLFELAQKDFKRFAMYHGVDALMERAIAYSIAHHFQKYEIPFFQAIPPEKYSLLAELSRVEEFREGQVIFRQGDIGDSFHMIAHGSVAVSVATLVPNTQAVTASIFEASESGADVLEIPSAQKTEQKVVATLGNGQYFGEIALVIDTPRTATITCQTRCILLTISRKNFNIFFEEAPEALSDFELKLSPANVQLRTLLHHPIGVNYLRKQLKTEYSMENLEFWQAVKHFKRCKWSDSDIYWASEKNETQRGRYRANKQRLIKKMVECSLDNKELHTSKFHFERFKKILSIELDLAEDPATTKEQIEQVVCMYPAAVQHDLRESLQNHRRVKLSAQQAERREAELASFSKLVDREMEAERLKIFFDIVDCCQDDVVSLEQILKAFASLLNVRATKTEAKMVFKSPASITKEVFCSLMLADYPAKKAGFVQEVRLEILKVDFKKWLDIFDDLANETVVLNDMIMLYMRRSIFYAEVVKLHLDSMRPKTTTTTTASAASASASAAATDADASDTAVAEARVAVTILEIKEKFESAGLQDAWNGDMITRYDYFIMVLSELRRQQNFQRYLAMRASAIFTEFVSQNAPQMVNITSAQHHDIAREMKAVTESLNTTGFVYGADTLLIDQSMFNAADVEIVKLMGADTFGRFKHSTHFADFLTEIGIRGIYEDQVDAREKRAVKNDGVVSNEQMKLPSPMSYANRHEVPTHSKNALSAVISEFTFEM